MFKMVFWIRVLALCTPLFTSWAYSQTLKGRITDAESKTPLPGVLITFKTDSVIRQCTSNEAGFFIFKSMPLGLANITFLIPGYITKQLVTRIISGKESNLSVAMEERVIQGDEITVTAQQTKSESRNAFNLISTHVFNAEDASRFAGSRNDPARMAANYAGVSGANDSRNDIIVRGNSPLGVLWRINGLDVPNPNHFGNIGASGGPISIINTNVLDVSDFSSGAFSSHYGNALSGVFDLKWRRGNTDTREYLAQIGFNGFELGAEGPIGSKQQASYMVFYRYSTLGVFKALNIPFGTGSAVPEYQDYNMRIDWGTKRYGHFMLWSMGGVSTIALLYKDKLRAGANSLYGYANRNAYFNSKIGVLGMSHHYPINSKSYVSTYFGFSGSQNNIASDYIDSAFSTPDFTIPEYRQDFSVLKTGLHSVFHYKLNSKHFFESGIYIERIHLHLFDSSAIFFKPLLYSRLRHYTGAYFSNRWYAQWQIKMNARLRIQGGIYAQYLSLNSHAVIEPRFSIKYTHLNHHLGFACGLHSQTQPYYMYFSTTNFGALTNTSLDFTKALHVVLSHDFNLKSIWHFKSEAYYQYLYKVPVTYSASSFSALNLGADFLSPNITGLTNSGSGLNYGIEFTIERYFNAKYYILTTGSFFNSRYCGSDAIWRNTAFNGNYVINGLGGKEFQLTPAVSVIVDFKSTWAGGKRFTPIDLEKSRAQNKEIRFTDKAFSEQYPNYFRLDIRPGIRINKKHVTHELQIDFQNITQHDNVFQQTYNPKTQQLEYDYQLKLFIVPQYRILF